MESINILTGQFVTIRYEPANVVHRGFALLIDYLIMGVYIFFLSYLWEEFRPFFRVISWGMIFLLLSPVVFYHLLFELFTGGQTPGKMLTRIRVVNIDGTSPTPLAYFLRWLLMLVDLFPSGIGLGMFFITFSSCHQRIGDMAAGTIVVKNAKPVELNLERDFLEYTPDYKPIFPQVELLSDGQIRFINKMLFELRDKKAVSTSVASLAVKVKDTMKIESTLENIEFLETIVRDYNYYAIQGG
jgi:Predicted membrane protein/domain